MDNEIAGEKMIINFQTTEDPGNLIFNILKINLVKNLNYRYR